MGKVTHSHVGAEGKTVNPHVGKIHFDVGSIQIGGQASRRAEVRTSRAGPTQWSKTPSFSSARRIGTMATSWCRTSRVVVVVLVVLVVVLVVLVVLVVVVVVVVVRDSSTLFCFFCWGQDQLVEFRWFPLSGGLSFH